MTPAELKARREQLNLTQEQLAAALKVRQPHISRWECGRITPMRSAWLEQEFKRIEHGRALEHLAAELRQQD